ncbi:MAG: cupredoxin domain-containing protein [Actinomycetota bacterium]|nr:cupredoxin domain-containing protein [Actinomycetota bacterium]
MIRSTVDDLRLLSLLAAAAGITAAPGAGRAWQGASSLPRTIPVQALAKPTADGELRFRQRRLVAPRGRVTFVVTNPSRLGHNFAVRRARRRLGITPTISNGRRARLTLHLVPGVYVFYCAVPGHEASGMHGRLIVK